MVISAFSSDASEPGGLAMLRTRELCSTVPDVPQTLQHSTRYLLIITSIPRSMQVMSYRKRFQTLSAFFFLEVTGGFPEDPSTCLRPEGLGAISNKKQTNKQTNKQINKSLNSLMWLPKIRDDPSTSFLMFVFLNIFKADH